jgi:hypothetical protein
MARNFDKFTERARKVLALATEEAQRFGHPYIGTEHLLLGLVREEEGVAARVLTNMGVQLPKVRSAMEFSIGRGEGAGVGETGLTPRAKKVIELAVDEARRLDDHHIGTEHLLLGLVREGEGNGAGILESLGTDLDKVRQQVMLVVDQGPRRSAERSPKTEIGSWPESSKLKALRTDLDLARQEGDDPRARKVEFAIADQELRELNAFRSRLVERLISHERRRLEMDSETRRLLDEIESLGRQRISAVEKKAKAKLDVKSAEDSTSESDEDDSEGRPSAQD